MYGNGTYIYLKINVNIRYNKQCINNRGGDINVEEIKGNRYIINQLNKFINTNIQ